VEVDPHKVGAKVKKIMEIKEVLTDVELLKTGTKVNRKADLIADHSMVVA
jgi:hypothetical protein